MHFLDRPRRTLVVSAALGFVAFVSLGGGTSEGASWQPLPGMPPNDTSVAPAIQPLPDGTYELAYRVRGVDRAKQAITSAVLSGDGQITPAVPITGDWATLSNPGLTIDGGQLRAYWGGIADTSWQSPVPGLETATAPSSSGPWRGQFGGIEVATCQSATDPGCPSGGYLAELYSYASDISATATSAGPLAAWSGTLGVYVRSGTVPPRDTDSGSPGFPPGDDPEDPTNAIQVNQEGNDDHAFYPSPSFQPQCCGYEPRLAVDSASGRPYLGWFSNASSRPGMLIQPVDPVSGSPQSGPYQVPGSTDTAGLRGLTPLSGLPGFAGVYTAIPSGKQLSEVVMAGYGIEATGTFASQKYVVSKGEGEVRNTAIAPDDGGHLWVVWTRDAPDGLTVSASRWDVKTGKFSAPTTVPAPRKAVDSYTLEAVALKNGVEVIGEFGPTSSGGMGSLSHTMLELTPTVNARSLSVRRGQKANVQVRVNVAGKPLSGATVTPVGAFSSRARKRRPVARTNSRGVARLRLGPFHRSTTVRLRVTKRGYDSLAVRIRVRVQRPSRHH